MHEVYALQTGFSAESSDGTVLMQGPSYPTLHPSSDVFVSEHNVIAKQLFSPSVVH